MRYLHFSSILIGTISTRIYIYLMKTIFSLVLLLLVLSLHACNLQVLHNQDSHYPITKKKDEKLNAGCVPMQLAAESKNSVAEASGEEKTDDQQKNLEVKDDGVINGSDFRKNWRVPHRKRGEKDAGFNLDYLPPKTHPPVHN